MCVLDEKNQQEYLKLNRTISNVRVAPRVCESAFSDLGWESIKKSREFLSDWQQSDPHGNQCASRATSERQRSATAASRAKRT